ncbi:hypothetical protein AMJ49_03775 [Parcubacteria bacterium DG_74_2]|nr:MAG: hypothetical protein AMJ49_03775 [Parcubacteria bacterium DG_74_2]
MLEIKIDIGLRQDDQIEKLKEKLEEEELKITVDSERVCGKAFVFFRGKRDKVNNAVKRFQDNGLEIIRKVETEIDNMSAVIAC